MTVKYWHAGSVRRLGSGFAFAKGHAWLGVRDFVHGVTGDTALGVFSKFAGRPRGHGGVFSNIWR